MGKKSSKMGDSGLIFFLLRFSEYAYWTQLFLFNVEGSPETYFSSTLYSTEDFSSYSDDIKYIFGLS